MTLHQRQTFKQFAFDDLSNVCEWTVTLQSVGLYYRSKNSMTSILFLKCMNGITTGRENKSVQFFPLWFKLSMQLEIYNVTHSTPK